MKKQSIETRIANARARVIAAQRGVYANQLHIDATLADIDELFRRLAERQEYLRELRDETPKLKQNLYQQRYALKQLEQQAQAEYGDFLASVMTA